MESLSNTKLTKGQTLSSTYHARAGKITEQYEKYFRYFLILPKLLAYIYAAIYIITGIVLAIVFNEGAFVLIGLGAIFAPIMCFFMKISMSGKILEVFYLNRILERTSNADREVEKQEEELENDLPEI